MKRLLIALLFIGMVLFVVVHQETAAPLPRISATPEVAALFAMTAPVPMAAPQQVPGTGYSAFDSAFSAPLITGVGTATATYSAGTIYAGGVAKAITAGTLTSLGASNTGCTLPVYSSCGFVYWTSGTALSYTTTFSTAAAANNVIVAYILTDGSSNITGIVPSSLNLPTPENSYETCGSTTTCSKTSAGFPAITVSGTSVPTIAGAATITALPFTDTTYQCMGYPTSVTGTTSAGAVIPLALSATSAKFTVTGNSGTDVTIGFTCYGH